MRPRPSNMLRGIQQAPGAVGTRHVKTGQEIQKGNCCNALLMNFGGHEAAWEESHAQKIIIEAACREALRRVTGQKGQGGVRPPHASISLYLNRFKTPGQKAIRSAAGARKKTKKGLHQKKKKQFPWTVHGLK